MLMWTLTVLVSCESRRYLAGRWSRFLAGSSAYERPPAWQSAVRQSGPGPAVGRDAPRSRHAVLHRQDPVVDLTTRLRG